MIRALFVASSLAVASFAQTYTLTDFGTQCGGDLIGQVVQGPQGAGLRLGVNGAQPNAVAILALGHRAPGPITLPGSNCTLLVDARHTIFTTTDAAGHAAFFVQLPRAVPITVLFQAVTANFSRAGRQVESTDGLQLVGR